MVGASPKRRALTASEAPRAMSSLGAPSFDGTSNAFEQSAILSATGAFEVFLAEPWRDVCVP